MSPDVALAQRVVAAGLEPDAIDAALQRRRLLDALFDAPASAPTIGRYSVVGLLGQGGMGVVYEAHDPSLDRRVAIKILHDGRAPASLLREAQAMARVVHPNVVPVFDFGTLERSRLFVVMQYVQGQTLRAWLKKPRSQAEVLKVFIEAGAGLAAAHNAGLLHRDFKPDNVLIGTGGRVQVTDFGLARDDQNREALGSPAPHDSSSGQLTPRARTTAIAGTPAYMAPEQASGRGVDVRSDVFSFCVTLYEALAGVRPGQEARSPPSAPGRPPIPTWLLAVIDRGLHSDPDMRWPNVNAVLEALRRPRRRRRLLGGMALLGGVALLSTFLGRGTIEPRQPSTPQPAQLARLTATLAEELAVAAHQVRGGQYPQAAATLEATFDAAVRARKPDIAAEAAVRLVFIEGRLRGQFEVGRVWARHAQAQLAQLPESVPAAAVLHSNLGILALSQGDHETAAPHFQRALDMHLKHRGPTDVAVGHAYDDLGTWHFETRDFEAARRYYEKALEIFEAQPDPDLAAIAMLLDDLGNADEELGFRGLAQERYQDALGLREGLPSDDPNWAVSWANLGTAARRDGRLEEALDWHQRALALREESMGPDHPLVGKSLADVAVVLLEQGHQDRAVAMLSRAQIVMEAAYGSEHRWTRRIANHLAHAHEYPTSPG